MPTYVVRILAATDTLANLELAIQQSEQLGFTAVSVATGTVRGMKGNLLTLLVGAPANPATLKEIDDAGSNAEQSDLLNDAAGTGTVVGYGGVYVDGALTNVALIRS